MINVKMQQDSTQPSLSPKITVIGVGGAGGNAVNNMIASNLEGCEFLVCNTDSQALGHSLCENRIQLGTQVTGGLGAGSKPEVGKASAEESLEDVLEYLDGANMAFVTAGMGGGTGTGAAPVIAKACRERGILTVGVVTKPFHFEGSHRMRMAEEGLKEMQNYVDTLIVIPNQNLFRVANEKTTFADGFKMADSVLQSGVRGVTDLMVKPGLVNLDFADIRTAMLEMGKAMMGTGEASGEKRATEAAEAAINNPLLDDVTMKGARGVIINVTGGYDMTLFEADEACNRIRDEVDTNANIIFGATFDEKMEGKMRVSIVATGIEREAIALEEPPKAEEEKPAEQPQTFQSPLSMMGNGRTYTTGIDNLRGITAPKSASAAVQTPKTEEEKPAEQPAQSQGVSSPSFLKPAQTQKPAERTPEQSDLLSEAPQAKVKIEKPATMAKATRYKDAFIPPQPVMTGGMDKPAMTMPSPQMPTATPATQQAATTQEAASTMQQPKEEKTAPQNTQSFFQRLASSMQRLTSSMETSAHADHAHAPMTKTAPPVSSGGTMMRGNAAATAPAQGQLNIDAPSSKPADDDLDIPAFLRRQAN